MVGLTSRSKQQFLLIATAAYGVSCPMQNFVDCVLMTRRCRSQGTGSMSVLIHSGLTLQRCKIRIQLVCALN